MQEPMLAKAAMEEAAAALKFSSPDEPQRPDDAPRLMPDATAANAAAVRAREGSPDLAPARGGGATNFFLPRAGAGISGQATPDVRLWHRAVVVHQENSLRGLVRQLSIDQLDNEGRRVSVYDGGMDPAGGKSPLFAPPPLRAGDKGTHKRCINELLRPRMWKAPEERAFFLTAQDIGELCDNAEAIFREEPTVLDLRAPIKIFGDLHGQFGDLMRLFEEYGTPSTAGDITYIDYLFLGDYVDRGSHSLETICLLLALKIEHPRSIHLIRGNHEAHDINALFGFRLECLERLGDEAGVWVWRRINDLFNFLPLAALIESKIMCMPGGTGRSVHEIDVIMCMPGGIGRSIHKIDVILCMHGGIGRSIHKIDQIAAIPRPVTMEDGGPVLMDLLWSDPTTNDAVTGVQPSPRGPGLVTFGPDRVKEFCKSNGLQMIVRAHECVMDGFERFASGHLITLFSATNYCGTAGNAGAILVLGRDLVMVPKLIHPLPPSEPHTPDSQGNTDEAHNMNDAWMQSINDERPPTPPRGRPHLPGSSLEYF
ncbi:hypothetical protein FOA52_007569 [Chlamydomonas sp. UWO 241]|nr:hypothetical protein FOA52_007569 [Chlamydomonas sp. UWO 241]